jgi:ABC-type polysaccharide/polyol phosphate transport system ATPase subunit
VTAAIELKGVGKRYWRPQEDAMLLRSLLPFVRKKVDLETWALRDVDFSIEEGETVGVLGRNGAGKTTMLRLLAGVAQPTEGRVRVVGRIAPLISVGVGFHPEMSGRENVYVNGMLLGLTEKQVKQRFDTIVAFSELADFIDTPVKFYSSGMLTRLGMAVAVHVEPRVLLVDEVLAVGDLAFQAKCLDRMRYLQSIGTTVLIVSHSMHAIQAMCPRALVFSKGRLVHDGDASTAINKHYELMAVRTEVEEEAAPGRPITVVDRSLSNSSGTVHRADRNDRLTYRVRIKFHAEVKSPQLRFQIRADDNSLVYAARSVLNDEYRTFQPGEEADVELQFTAGLGGGNYHINLTVFSYDGMTTIFDEIRGYIVYLPPVPGSAGVTDLEGQISLDGAVRNDHPPMLFGQGSTSAR